MFKKEMLKVINYMNSSIASKVKINFQFYDSITANTNYVHKQSTRR